MAILFCSVAPTQKFTFLARVGKSSYKLARFQLVHRDGSIYLIFRRSGRTALKVSYHSSGRVNFEKSLSVPIRPKEVSTVFLPPISDLATVTPFVSIGLTSVE